MQLLLALFQLVLLSTTSLAQTQDDNTVVYTADNYMTLWINGQFKGDLGQSSHFGHSVVPHSILPACSVLAVEGLNWGAYSAGNPAAFILRAKINGQLFHSNSDWMCTTTEPGEGWTDRGFAMDEAWEAAKELETLGEGIWERVGGSSANGAMDHDTDVKWIWSNDEAAGSVWCRLEVLCEDGTPADTGAYEAVTRDQIVGFFSSSPNNNSPLDPVAECADTTGGFLDSKDVLTSPACLQFAGSDNFETHIRSSDSMFNSFGMDIAHQARQNFAGGTLHWSFRWSADVDATSSCGKVRAGVLARSNNHWINILPGRPVEDDSNAWQPGITYCTLGMADDGSPKIQTFTHAEDCSTGEGAIQLMHTISDDDLATLTDANNRFYLGITQCTSHLADVSLLSVDVANPAEDIRQPETRAHAFYGASCGSITGCQRCTSTDGCVWAESVHSTSGGAGGFCNALPNACDDANEYCEECREGMEAIASQLDDKWSDHARGDLSIEESEIFASCSGTPSAYDNVYVYCIREDKAPKMFEVGEDDYADALSSNDVSVYEAFCIDLCASDDFTGTCYVNGFKLSEDSTTVTCHRHTGLREQIEVSSTDLSGYDICKDVCTDANEEGSESRWTGRCEVNGLQYFQGVTLYEGFSFTGKSQDFAIGEWSSQDFVRIRDNAVSSIRLANGAQVEIHDGDALTFDSLEVTESVTQLLSSGFNDRLSSLLVTGNDVDVIMIPYSLSETSSNWRDFCPPNLIEEFIHRGDHAVDFNADECADVIHYYVEGNVRATHRQCPNDWKCANNQLFTSLDGVGDRECHACLSLEECSFCLEIYEGAEPRGYCTHNDECPSGLAISSEEEMEDFGLTCPGDTWMEDDCSSTTSCEFCAAKEECTFCGIPGEDGWRCIEVDDEGSCESGAVNIHPSSCPVTGSGLWSDSCFSAWSSCSCTMRDGCGWCQLTNDNGICFPIGSPESSLSECESVEQNPDVACADTVKPCLQVTDCDECSAREDCGLCYSANPPSADTIAGRMCPSDFSEIVQYCSDVFDVLEVGHTTLLAQEGCGDIEDDMMSYFETVLRRCGQLNDDCQLQFNTIDNCRLRYSLEELDWSTLFPSIDSGQFDLNRCVTYWEEMNDLATGVGATEGSGGEDCELLEFQCLDDNYFQKCTLGWEAKHVWSEKLRCPEGTCCLDNGKNNPCVHEESCEGACEEGTYKCRDDGTYSVCAMLYDFPVWHEAQSCAPGTKCEANGSANPCVLDTSSSATSSSESDANTDGSDSQLSSPLDSPECSSQSHINVLMCDGDNSYLWCLDGGDGTVSWSDPLSCSAGTVCDQEGFSDFTQNPCVIAPSDDAGTSKRSLRRRTQDSVSILNRAEAFCACEDVLVAVEDFGRRLRQAKDFYGTLPDSTTLSGFTDEEIEAVEQLSKGIAFTDIDWTLVYPNLPSDANSCLSFVNIGDSVTGSVFSDAEDDSVHVHSARSTLGKYLCVPGDEDGAKFGVCSAETYSYGRDETRPLDQAVCGTSQDTDDVEENEEDNTLPSISAGCAAADTVPAHRPSLASTICSAWSDLACCSSQDVMNIYTQLTTFVNPSCQAAVPPGCFQRLERIFCSEACMPNFPGCFEATFLADTFQECQHVNFICPRSRVGAEMPSCSKDECLSPLDVYGSFEQFSKTVSGSRIGTGARCFDGSAYFDDLVESGFETMMSLSSVVEEDTAVTSSAPTLILPTVATVSEGQDAALSMTAVDLDGDDLTIALDEFEVGASVTPEHELVVTEIGPGNYEVTFSWRPTTPGEFQYCFVVVDVNENIDSGCVHVVVEEVPCPNDCHVDLGQGICANEEFCQCTRINQDYYAGRDCSDFVKYSGSFNGDPHVVNFQGRLVHPQPYGDALILSTQNLNVQGRHFWWWGWGSGTVVKKAAFWYRNPDTDIEATAINSWGVWIVDGVRITVPQEGYKVANGATLYKFSGSHFEIVFPDSSKIAMTLHHYHVGWMEMHFYLNWEALGDVTGGYMGTTPGRRRVMSIDHTRRRVQSVDDIEIAESEKVDTLDDSTSLFSFNGETSAVTFALPDTFPVTDAMQDLWETSSAESKEAAFEACKGLAEEFKIVACALDTLLLSVPNEDDDLRRERARRVQDGVVVDLDVMADYQQDPWIDSSPQECGSVSPLSLENIVVVGGEAYSLLGGYSPYDQSKACQTEYFKLPRGWTLASRTQVLSVISSNSSLTWGCDCLVTSDGSSVHVVDLSECGERQLSTVETCYKPKPQQCTVSQKILIVASTANAGDILSVISTTQVAATSVSDSSVSPSDASDTTSTPSGTTGQIDVTTAGSNELNPSIIIGLLFLVLLQFSLEN